MEQWTFAYQGFEPQQERLREALCTLGNGYFATRGAAPESRAGDVHYPGTYVAGCFNRLSTDIAGRALEHESVVNMPNWLPLTFRIGEGRWFDLNESEVLEYRQELQLRPGVMIRTIRFRDEEGRTTRLTQRRLVHMALPHLAALETTICPEDWSGPIEVSSGLDGRVANTGVDRYRDLNGQHLTNVETQNLDPETVLIQAETSQSKIRVAEAGRTRVFMDGYAMDPERQVVESYGRIDQRFSMEVSRGHVLTIEKIVSIYTSTDRAISESGSEACKTVSRADGFESLFQSHALAWESIWERFGVDLETDDHISLALRFHIFHLAQTVSRNSVDLDVGVPPRGLHGEAYRGHIMWDELFVFPLLNLRAPFLTRSLLLYRFRRLEEARWAGRQAGYEGAMFPWQSGSNGREESQVIHLNPRSGRWIPDNSHLQRHISIAVAYNVWSYYQVTADWPFISSYGAELILEVARFWASAASYNQSLGRYDVHGVMGPDEYHEAYPDSDTPGLSNNAYTNVMVVWVMCRALECVDLLPELRKRELFNKLDLRPLELERWDDISRKMFIPFHDGDIISQFEGYEKLEEFDWERYRAKYGNIQRLDRILEAEGDSPNRYKASKQADVLMLFYLLSSDELTELLHRIGYSFSTESIPKNVEYYLARTSHGSTLSGIVHSWVLSRSNREQSWELFKQALKSDVSDIQGGTTSEGIHLGAMAGTVDLMLRCYSGIETRGDVLRFGPALPPELSSIKFSIEYRGHQIEAHIDHGTLTITARLFEVAPVRIGCRGKVVELAAGQSHEFPLR